MSLNVVSGSGEKKKIGRLLIESELITADQLDEALVIQKKEGGKVVQILVNLGYLDAERMSHFMSKQPGIPSIELSNYQVQQDVIDLIPREFAVKNEVFPIDKMGKLLSVGMSFPLDSVTINQMEEMTSLKVKALLCRKSDILNAIERFYKKPEDAEDAVETEEVADSTATVDAEAERVETGARLESIAQIIRQIDSLPTLPQTVQRVREAAESPDSSLQDIAQIVSQDPPIAAKLLQLANSAAYGFKNKINSVELAISLLGLQETCSTVLSSAVLDLTEKTEGFDHERFWKESMYCATVAKLIAEACKDKRAAGVFTAGLLCRIGRFALSQAAPVRYAKLDGGLMSPDLKSAEEDLLGIGHQEAGYILADHWSLPPEISEPIRFHLTPENAKDFPELVQIVSLAAHLTDLHQHDLHLAAEHLEAELPMIAGLGLDVPNVTEICATAAAAVE